MEKVSLLTAFSAGFVSFIAPCVLPLVPGYISYITGLSFEEIEHHDRRTSAYILKRALLFCLGFIIIFTLLGVLAAFFGASLAVTYRPILNKVAGILIILMGLYVSGIFKLTIFTRDYRFQFKKIPSGPFGPVIMGISFAIAWSPCVGPILAAILFYAGTLDTVGSGAWLLLVYSLGLSIPLVVTALFFSRVITAISWIKKHYQIIMAISGGFLILMGILMIMDKFGYFNAAMQQIYYKLKFNPF